MPIVRILRLLLTLLALGFAMANPAAAVPAMASATNAAAMPCHETAAATPAKPSPAVPSIAGGVHLCCVLACLVVPPLGEIALSHPAARASVLAPVAMLAPSGRMVAMPTPPPRLS